MPDKSNPFEGAGYDSEGTTNHFEFGDGGRDPEIEGNSPGVEEGTSATVARGLNKSKPWADRSDVLN